MSFGDEHQKTTYLRELATGKEIGGFMLTEPQAGSSLTHPAASAGRPEWGSREEI